MLVLLVEDDKFFQNFYTTKLQENGFTVEMAGNGDEGLQKLATIRPDLILLDLIMPVKDGFEFLGEMGKNASLKTIPVLVFSTLGQNNDILRAKSLGASDFVNKTFFDFDTLLAKINQLVKK